MRIIAGTARGRKLKMAPGGKTRPAMDRVKESLFAILGFKIVDCRFLDLFAGSGSLGLEALSRGAAMAVFVDSFRPCVNTIKANAELLGFTEQTMVFQQDCQRFIKSQQLEPFDIVCIDPPYLKGLLEPILDLLPDCPMMTATSLFIVERQKKDDLNLQNRPEFELVDERIFGDTVVTMFRCPGKHPTKPKNNAGPT